MLNFIDFEVYEHDWLCVIINPMTGLDITIANDYETFKKFHEEHKNEIYVGYNIKNYDQWIIKAVLCEFNPKRVNDFIIAQNKPGYNYSPLFKEYPIIFFDIMPNPPVSLKTLEAFMGINIKETDVDFNTTRKLTEEELKLTEYYCHCDVEATIEVFTKRSKEFDSHMSLISAFNLPLSDLGKTKAQLSAKILGCEKTYHDDEWNITIIDTLRLKKYASVIDWFNTHKNYQCRLDMNVAGVPHTFAWGGLHGAKTQYHGTGLILHVDVNSFYPSIMIKYGLLSRSVRNPDKYREIRDKRLQYKKEKNPLQAPYKIVLNSTYGISKDPYSPAYDPRRANEVCINGQLLLLDLIEHLESVPGFELIQSNTDGLIIKIPDTDDSFNEVDDICYEWETRTGMGLGFDFIKEIYQKDVNNYIFIDQDEKVERKGAYVKENNDLDNDMAIVNTAIVQYMVNKIPPRQTIMECNDIKQFQKVVKVSMKYDCAVYDGKMQNEKTFRVFASNKNDGSIYKQKSGKKPEKFANTPENCFIINGPLGEMPSKLDKEYYIALAEQRLADFGLAEFDKQMRLFH